LQLATQQLQLQNGVLHVDFFLQLATQRLLRCKLQEKSFRVTWPLNWKRGTGNREQGTGSWERGTGNGERGTGNGKRGYSGNPPENSKWQRKRRLQTLILSLGRRLQCNQMTRFYSNIV